MFKNAGSKFLLGFGVTSLLTVIVTLLMIFPKEVVIVLVFAVVSYMVGSLLFRLGFKYNEDGDLIRETKKYDDC